MGLEVRRVPANWEHPRYTPENAPRPKDIGEHQPLSDGYEDTLAAFAADIERLGLAEAIERYGGGPLRENYVDYGGRPCEWWQLYETVSEGTPITPAFATAEELVDYLVEHGDAWEAMRAQRDGRPVLGYTRANAEQLVRVGWAPSAYLGRAPNRAEPASPAP